MGKSDRKSDCLPRFLDNGCQKSDGLEEERPPIRPIRLGTAKSQISWIGKGSKVRFARVGTDEKQIFVRHENRLAGMKKSKKQISKRLPFHFPTIMEFNYCRGEKREKSLHNL